MTKKEIICWIAITIFVSSAVIFLVCGCAGGGVSYDPGPLSGLAIDDGGFAASHPYYTYEPQNVWVRTLGQPDQLVTVMPAF